MEPLKETPTFNLKAVVQETGLKPDTLRAWERRYGLPEPDRTQGGHRLYSRFDIELLKWLISRQDEGLSISRAVNLWRRLEAEGRAPQLVSADVALISGNETITLTGGEAVQELRQSWVDACLEFDEQQAENVLTQAFARYPVETVCLELLSQGMAEVGAGWYQGEITVQQEHFASALAMRRLEALVAGTPPPTRNGRILVICAPEDTHTFSPLLITLLLRRRGYDVTYLGGNVPAARLESTIHHTKPDLVIASAQQLPMAANLIEVTDLLNDAGVPLGYGGMIFNAIPKLRERIPGHFLGETFEQIPPQVEQLLKLSPAPPEAPVPSEAYRKALSAFRTRRARVEAQVWERTQGQERGQMHLTNANYHLARNITAALALGDMQFLGSDIDWVRGLLVNYQIPVEELEQYIDVYCRAAEDQLGEDGRPIIDWLSQIAGKE